jgi:hypothetical protein
MSGDPGCMARGHGMGLSWAHDLLAIGAWSEVSMGVWHGSHGHMACGYPRRMAWGCPRRMSFHVMLAIGNPMPWVWNFLKKIFKILSHPHKISVFISFDFFQDF